jgi:hypothetical protein
MVQTLLLAALVIAFGAWTGRRLLDTANDPTPAVLAALSAHADPLSIPPAPPRRRLVLALLDGLGAQYLRPLANEGALGEIAWRAHVDVGTPSLSRPVYHVLLTGVPQQVSGIRSNSHQGPERADSLPDRVRASGAEVAWALEKVRWLYELAGGRGETVLHGAAVHDPAAFTQLYEGGATLIVLHLIRPDEAGHAHGARSAQYRQAARDAVHTVATLRAAIASHPDAARTVWFVGADHGHLPQGGHGGPEASVRQTLWLGLWPHDSEAPPAAMEIPGLVPATRLAPTFAAAMGIAPPREALSPPLPLPEGRAPDLSEARVARAQATEAALVASESEAARARTVRALLCVLGLALATAALVRRAHGPRVLGAGLVVLGEGAGFAVLGPGWTLSAIRTHLSFQVQSVLALALGAALVWPLARRLGARLRSTVLASALPPLVALAVTGGSTGLALVGPYGALLWPATGMMPAGLVLGVFVSELLGRAARRR